MENVRGRELFSELLDNLINPLLFHMVPPFVNENDPMYSPCSSINDFCLFMFGNRTKSNIAFTVNDLDRSDDHTIRSTDTPRFKPFTKTLASAQTKNTQSEHQACTAAAMYTSPLTAHEADCRFVRHVS